MTWQERGNHLHQKIDSLMIGQICRIEYILCRQDTTLRIKKTPFSKKIWLSIFFTKRPIFLHFWITLIKPDIRMGWSCQGARDGIVVMTWQEGGNHMRQKVDSLMIGHICRIEYIVCRQDITLRIMKAPFSK
jgi:hypothetical protein